MNFVRAYKKYRMSRDCFCFCQHQNNISRTTKNDGDDETKSICVGILTKLFYNTSLEFQLRFLNMK